MYTQVFGLYHDQTFSKAFLGFLMYLFEVVKFDYPKLSEIIGKSRERNY